MTRQEYSEEVKRIMCGNPMFGPYHAQNFRSFAQYGEMAPINSSIINDMPRGKIILSEQVYDMLMAISDVTNSEMEEVPFFLFGTETSDNTIEFSEFMSSSRERQGTQASFDQNMVKYLQDRINGNMNDGLVVCHGHSHPPIGSYNENFSLGDFTSYMQMNRDNEIFRSRKIELVGCVVTSTGDINFVFYDNRHNDFYRFTQVYVKDMQGNLTPANSYGLNQRDNYGMHI